FLASARNVRFGAARLDTVQGALQIRARRLSGDARQVLYEFSVTAADGAAVADGRAVVVLNTPLTT
ncbi:MAG: hydroxymyristoyl-ACP dehydratase, partial [Comamonadaceae bacterium]